MPIQHRVRSGECVESIASQYGFFPRTIWDFADNAALRDERGRGDQLVAGDAVAVPDKTMGEEGAATGARHRFRRRGVPSKLRLRILYLGEPRARTPFKVDIHGRTVEGETDGDGYLEIPIQPGDKRAHLVVGDQEAVDGDNTDTDNEDQVVQEYDLQLGHLEPIETLAGVQSRLSNLGYHCDRELGVMNDQTREAIRLFQESQEFDDPDGDLNDETRDAIEALHGS